MTEKLTGLALLRQPFPAHQISKMCRSTKKDNQKSKCGKCGGFHGQPSVQLSYVGHAALTDRLLEADPTWTWWPFSLGADGYPVVDKNGGMWIKLRVCGVERMGYGDAQNRTGGDGVKEMIGDAIRNAAMRFGAALDLWHKGDLHLDADDNGSDVFITLEQATEIDLLVTETNTDVARLLEWAGCQDISRIPASKYPATMSLLTAKKNKMGVE